MKRILGSLLVFSSVLLAENSVNVGDIVLDIPEGWKLLQKGDTNDATVVTFTRGSESTVFIAHKNRTASMQELVANNVSQSGYVSGGPLKWEVTSLNNTSDGQSGAAYVFLSKHQTTTYYGYTKSASLNSAQTNAQNLWRGMFLMLQKDLSLRSLTPVDFSGRKFYLGWGIADPGDPSNMHNEVKYDVQHTHDVFTKDAGGKYQGTKYIAGQATPSAIRNVWKQFNLQMNEKDMYVQYSSGHGSPSGLGMGLSYTEIRDNVLKLPAQEKIIFIMACHSGALVDAFNQKKSEWSSNGKTLWVFASSRASELSSTGPGQDENEQGPYGSAGSAFGYALWKALSGKADGTIDGIKDGFLSIEEIRSYTTKTSQKIGQQNPVETGNYHPALVINQVPSAKFLDTLSGGTEDLSDDQIIEKLRLLDEELRVR